MQQNMVKRFCTKSRRFYKDAQVIHHLVLSAEIFELKRTKSVLKITLFSGWLIIAYVKLFFHKFFKSMTKKVRIKEESPMKNPDFRLYIVFLSTTKPIRISL